MSNIFGIMKQAEKLQEKMKSMQDNLSLIEAEGASGGGLVTIKINGSGDIKNIDIDPSILIASEKEIIEDLIIAAYSDAKSKANIEVAKKMKEVAGDLPIPPGFNLGL
ncbi:MAG: YbaB/EbfC family nucleoid-associated protein [Rhodobiaceae bacterium]|jgi:DNA-binding YbaB/EbfC family protein|nr:YbaB/EbfC family nucleoid-associated protein [Rhodobiaceae bacterium]MBT5640199.1 YbaB/EbfC family nucleoid-associated protein [Rhodobiaceae bacterium]MBT6222752.1 YbaB/EbfC family nucleoid-associated protein [Rhodobiaceae bacterium]MDC3272171.1 YbaB/EbfC family nucleoid-associated protein [Hyphomicrobiales bacterium]|tara:strand:+ start:3412 stop:3735 length:324 start_codon:yes stop_codon:yes gene_type:complete